MPAGQAVAEVSKPSGMSPELFEAEFVRPGKPIVLRGLVSDWPARKWTFPDIAEHFPKRPFRASGVSPSDGLRVQTWNFSPEEIARKIAGRGASNERDAPHPDWLFDLLEDLPELVPALPPPNVSRGEIQYRLFMGRDTKTPGHYHTYQHAMLCMIHGRKRVLMYAPDDSSRLYPYPVNPETRHYQSSRVDFAEPDLRVFPKLQKTHLLEATLEPGDALFVPIHWWHAVYGAGSVMSASLFWNARLRDYRFPHPGLKTVAGMMKRHAWQSLRGAVRAAGRRVAGVARAG